MALRIFSPLLALFLVCTTSLAPGEKWECLTGETICVDKELVVEQKVTAVFGGGNKLTSVSIRLDSTVVEMKPDKLLNDAYFRDIAAFIRVHPDTVTSVANGSLTAVDVVMRPPAEVDSMRLLDRLAPGDGSVSLIVSRALRDRGEPRAADDPLAHTFSATCWADREPRCWSQFPIFGFRASYPLPEGWDEVIERDRQIRSMLATLVKPCD